MSALTAKAFKAWKNTREQGCVKRIGQPQNPNNSASNRREIQMSAETPLVPFHLGSRLERPLCRWTMAHQPDHHLLNL